jgi:F0F1-type ATP synthase assembly protein I
MTAVSGVLVVLTTWWLIGPVAERHGWPRWVALGAAVPVVFALEPVRETLGWGQIDLVIAALVLADVGVLGRGSRWAVRAAAGAAAAVVGGCFLISLIWFFAGGPPRADGVGDVLGRNAYVFLMLALVVALPARVTASRSAVRTTAPPRPAGSSPR